MYDNVRSFDSVNAMQELKLSEMHLNISILLCFLWPYIDISKLDENLIWPCRNFKAYNKLINQKTSFYLYAIIFCFCRSNLQSRRLQDISWNLCIDVYVLFVPRRILSPALFPMRFIDRSSHTRRSNTFLLTIPLICIILAFKSSISVHPRTSQNSPALVTDQW